MHVDRTVPDAIPRLPVRTLRVEVLDGADAGTTLVTESDTLTCGTADGNDLVLRDPTVSRFHAEFARHKDGVEVRDNGSTNGTFVATLRIERAVAPPGTTFRIGRTNVRVTDGEAKVIDLYADDVLAGLHGRTPAMRRLMSRVQKAAQSAA